MNTVAVVLLNYCSKRKLHSMGTMEVCRVDYTSFREWNYRETSAETYKHAMLLSLLWE